MSDAQICFTLLSGYMVFMHFESVVGTALFLANVAANCSQAKHTFC